MVHLHHVLFILFICIAIINISECYFLPGTLLHYDEMKRFCQEICGSELASIHSSKQMDDAVATINSRPKDIWSASSRGPDAYIGLYSPDFPSYTFSWSDNTPFNFGNNTTPSPIGNYPWKKYNPHGHTPDCVVLEGDTNSWNDVQCGYRTTTYEEDRFLCNHCNGKINKYGLVVVNDPGFAHYSAKRACFTVYGTSLASAHTDRDYYEMEALWKVHKETLWIGLEHGEDETDPNTYSWDDGTPFDYANTVSCITNGACFPYSGTGPDDYNGAEDCIAIGGISGRWDDKDCDNKYNYICNLPSEINTQLNNWINITGIWQFEPTETVITSSNSVSEDAVGIIEGKQWYNGDKELLIDYMFKVDFGGYEGISGIQIYNGVTSSFCDKYYIGIRKLSNQYYVELIRGDTTLKQEVIQFTYTNDIYYTLSITIIGGNQIVVSVNDMQHIDYTDNDGYNTLSNGLSGYISLSVGADLVTIARFLYISGTQKTVTPLITTGNCTSASPNISSSDTNQLILIILNTMFFLFIVIIMLWVIFCVRKGFQNGSNLDVSGFDSKPLYKSGRKSKWRKSKRNDIDYMSMITIDENNPLEQDSIHQQDVVNNLLFEKQIQCFYRSCN